MSVSIKVPPAVMVNRVHGNATRRSRLFHQSKRWASHPWRSWGTGDAWRCGVGGRASNARCRCTRCTGGAAASMHSPRFARSCRSRVDRAVPSIGRDRGHFDAYNYGGAALHFTRHTPCDRVTRPTPPVSCARCVLSMAILRLAFDLFRFHRDREIRLGLRTRRSRLGIVWSVRKEDSFAGHRYW